MMTSNSTTLPDIPPEIWLHIASFIPDSDLKGLVGVNRIFFDLAMGMRYGEPLIVTREVKDALRMVERLHDPFIAKYVRRLNLRLTHVKLDTLLVIQTENNNQTLENSSLRRVRGTVSRMLKAPSLKPKPPLTVKDIRIANFRELAARLAANNANFVNLEHFAIDSWDLSGEYDIRPLLVSSWEAFGARLRTLSIGGNLDGFRTILGTQPALGALEELHVEVANNIYRMDLVTDSETLAQVVAPFVVCLSGQLKSLRIWSWSDLDFSKFFTRLASACHFPILEDLNLRVDFNSGLAKDMEGFRNFVWDCSTTVRELELRLKPKGVAADTSVEVGLGQWLVDSLSDPRFLSQVRTLDFYATNLDVGLEVLVGYIERMAPRLEAFTSRDRYLQFAEVQRVMDALARCPRLRYLRLSIWAMEVRFLDLLSVKLPHITKLYLSVGRAFIGSDGIGDHTELSFDELSRKLYGNMQLKDLTIWQGGQKVDNSSMLALARCIPSITSFFETGHKLAS